MLNQNKSFTAEDAIDSACDIGSPTCLDILLNCWF